MLKYDAVNNYFQIIISFNQIEKKLRSLIGMAKKYTILVLKIDQKYCIFPKNPNNMLLFPYNAFPLQWVRFLCRTMFQIAASKINTNQFWGQVFGASSHLERKRHKIFVSKSLCSVVLQPWRLRFLIAGQSWRTVLSQKVAQIAVRRVLDDYVQRS